MELKSVKILECDTSDTFSKRIYPMAMIEKAIEEYMAEPSPAGGELQAVSEAFAANQFTFIPIADISHVVTNLYLNRETKEVFADIKILDTPAGDLLRNLLAFGEDTIRFSPLGAGMVDIDTKEVSCYVLKSVCYKVKE